MKLKQNFVLFLKRQKASALVNKTKKQKQTLTYINGKY